MNSGVLDYIASLRRTALFEGLETPDLEALVRQAHPLWLRKGQTLFLQGDPVRYLYVVISGLIKVYRPDPKGQRQVVLHLEGPLRPVAAVAVFLEKPCYPASAEALEDSQLLAIPKESFFGLVDTRPPVARAMIRFLAKRQQQLVHLLDRLVFHEVGARLAEYLLEQARQAGGGFRLPTNPELAALLGTGPEPVSRKLGEFLRQGFIEMQARRVWIKDTKALEQIADKQSI